MKMISPGATSIEMLRNTSIRREPIRNDWNKSRAINCGCTHNYSAKIDIVQHRHLDLFLFAFRTLKPPRNFRGGLSEFKVSLHHSERFQGRLVHRARWLNTLGGLILRQRRARLWSENTVDFALVITLLLQRRLHIGYNLSRILLRTRGVDRSIIIID